GADPGCRSVLGGGTALSEVRRAAPGRARPPRVPACRRPGHACPIRARSLDRFDALLALRSPRHPLVEGLRAEQPHLRTDPPGERLRLRRTGSPPACRGHRSDHPRCRLLALRGL
ncbi:MAG: hypothetical protein AVDCRST_MAG26-104, partial [uncultured Chloroflexia bacterium]